MNRKQNIFIILQAVTISRSRQLAERNREKSNKQELINRVGDIQLSKDNQYNQIQISQLRANYNLPEPQPQS